MLNSLYRFVVIAGLAFAAIVGLLIAWWIAMIAALGLVAWVGVRKLLGKPVWGTAGWNASVGARPDEDYRRAPLVIEGEFSEVQDARRRVERSDR